VALLSIIGSFLFATSMANGLMPTTVSVIAERAGSSNREVAYRLHATAGVGGATFGVEYRLPQWPSVAQVEAPTVGSPIQLTSVNLQGPGTLRPAAAFAVPKPRLKREETCRRERPSPLATAYWVELPPHASSVIELRGRGSYPSWPRTRYQVEFSTFETDEPGAPRTELRKASTPSLGPRGTRIDMRALPSQGTPGAAHMTPEIVGRTTPALRHARISLKAVRPPVSGALTLSQWSKKPPTSIPLGGVRTDAQGRFRVTPQKLSSSGRYAVLARSQRQGAIAADWNCGPFFMIKP
jgi:hypothetical protein